MLINTTGLLAMNASLRKAGMLSSVDACLNVGMLSSAVTSYQFE